MMKTAATVLLAVLICGVGCARASSQDQSNDMAAGDGRGKSQVALGGGQVTVEYGRPALKGRDLLPLLPIGQEWRMGSNAATTLVTDVGLKFGDAVVPPGRYILTAKRVSADAWQLRVLDNDKVVAETPLTYRNGSEVVEVFTIELPGKEASGELVLKWGTHVLTAPFRKA